MKIRQIISGKITTQTEFVSGKEIKAHGPTGDRVLFFCRAESTAAEHKKGSGKKDKKCERAMFFGNSGAHDTLSTKCQSSDLSDLSDL
ncbi:MAG: hypothetical protein IJC34_06655, partial [Lentisphaeria bacterium]|nr:hypothetical protein [Lentisphaeria bacterium]